MWFDVKRLIDYVLRRGPYCLIDKYHSILGLAYGDPKFAAIVHPYWTRGYGTTCAVVLSWVLEKCGWKGKLNRGSGWKIGAHVAPILDYAREKGALETLPPLDTLRPGDILYLEGTNPSDWHVGIVEKNEFPSRVITLDGGQSDARGEQTISRVFRPIVDGKLGPSPRLVKLVIRTERVL